MSAIAAIFNLDGAPADGQQVRTMTDAVAHRGPDGIGVWTSGPLAFGTCLLKSTPEAAFERLPLVTPDERYVITFDGRIDNRDEIAKALRIEPALLVVMPDSEMLLATYRKWGKDCVDRIAGDFAFAIWDSALNEIFCARDPVGVKLLHYFYDGKRFIVATEVSQIQAVVGAGVDPVTMALFLDVRNPQTDATFLEGVKKLPGGCRMTVTSSGPRVETYWNPDPSDIHELADDREYEEQFLELFKEAVRSRMRSVGPVGISLSGGMDSASVFATSEYMRKHESPDMSELRYYSNVYSGMEEVDESEYIKETVGLYDAPGKLIESGGFEDRELGSSPLGLQLAEPFVAPHEESHRRVFNEAQKDGCSVLLTGLGGDEVLAAGMGHLADMFRTFNLRAIRREWRYLPRWRWREAASDAAKSLIPFGSGIAEDETAEWLSEKSRRLRDSVESGFQGGERRKYRSKHAQENDNWIQIRGGLAGYTWADVTVAEYGLEPRHPFWDRRLIEFLLTVPPHVKYRFGFSKRVLRRAMKGILPENVRNRRYKTNFSSLMDVKTTQSMEVENSELLKSPMLAEMGFVDPEKLNRAWSEYKLTANDVENERRSALWATLTLERWLRRYMVDDGTGDEIGAVLSRRKTKLQT